jgi:hypothetical protein
MIDGSQSSYSSSQVGEVISNALLGKEDIKCFILQDQKLAFLFVGRLTMA